MKKKIFALIISLSLILCNYVIYYSIYTITKDQSHDIKAIKGVLDLKNVDINAIGVLPLDGEWEYSPDKLIMNTDEIIENNFIKYIKVPGSWKEDKKSNFKSINEVGTYHLKVLLNDKDIDKLYGIKTILIRMASEVYVNNELLIKSGNPAINKNDYKMYIKPQTEFFKPTLNELDIVVHVSNFDNNRHAGILKSIYFGESKDIQKLENKMKSTDNIIVSGWFLIGVYFLGLFFVRNKDKALLSFGLYSIFQGLYSLTIREKLIFSIFPNINYDLVTKIQFITVAICSIFLVLYIHYMFTQWSNKKMAKFIIIYSLFFAILGCFLPLSIRSRILTPLVISFLLATGYAIYVLVLGIVNKARGSVLMFIAVLSIIGILVKNALEYETNLIMYALLIIDPFVLILCQALLHSLKTADAYKNLDKISKKLVTTNKLKNEFVAKTSHEFKSPLNGIMNITQSVIDGVAGPLNESQKNNLRLVTNITEQLSILVKDILDITKIDHGEMDINIETFDIVITIKRVLNIYKFTNTNQNVKIIFKEPSDSVYANADINRTRQILYNLIENALKYTKQGTITINVEETKEIILVKICDTGKGISKELQQDIFKPFIRLESDKVKDNNQGLGLYIVKQLVELQGGNITITSEINKGSLFKFTLPKSKEGLKLAKQDIKNNIENDSLNNLNDKRVPNVNKELAKATIVLIDDEHHNIVATSNILINEGYRVISFKNGACAIEFILKNDDVDLVITDLMMPEMNGIELCQELRQHKSASILPILILTVASEPIDINNAYKKGANDYIYKPFGKDNLIIRVESLIRLKKSVSQTIKAEMALLQAQIKPHFLYNTLNTILSCSYTDIEDARELIGYLSDYLRGSVDFSNSNDLIPLSKELEHTECYLKIEKARFGNKLNVKLDINDIDGYFIPSFTIQTLVENAIRHGLLMKKDGGTLLVSTKEKEEMCIVTVQDDGIGMSIEKIKQIENYKLEKNDENFKCNGINNVNKRLLNFFGEKLKIQSEKDKGTTIVFKIIR